MDLKTRIQAFAELGKFLNQFKENSVEIDPTVSIEQEFTFKFKDAIERAKTENSWFTQANVIFALRQWANLLTIDKLENWLSTYSIESQNPKRIAVIMAGNIPLVGFHDFLSVLITGHNVLVKLSSNDRVLTRALTNTLIAIESGFKNRIEFTEEKLTGFDAVIATGSNNTARYFEYYFKNYPSIIRKNRNSIAILTGEETEDELKKLSEDIFRYYGLGCRNVSKVFVPEGYNFDRLFNSVYHWHPLIHEHKYANNYDYNKAVYLMSEYNILDNGFLILKQDNQFSSPIATLFYDFYKSLDALKEYVEVNKSQIQCVVSKSFIDGEIEFGNSQNPELTSYADNIDTVDFLLKTGLK